VSAEEVLHVMHAVAGGWSEGKGYEAGWLHHVVRVQLHTSWSDSPLVILIRLRWLSVP
jgi:hypothetical protein